MAERPLADKPAYDAVLVVSFGGPEKHGDVLPFLENVVRGRNIPRERLLEVAEHYYLFDGRSPINSQNRALVTALRDELERNGPALPVYWGNRNWHPFLTESLRKMADDGVRRALAFVTSAYSSYSGCRQYRENIAAAQAAAGEDAPAIDKLRVFFNHPGFIEPMVESTRAALGRFPAGVRGAVAVLYTAHSLPLSMARSSRYVDQLQEACRLVSEALDLDAYQLVYQSRSGPPSMPWLEPDILDSLRALASEGCRNVAVVPIGFVSDHLEILYDLDVEAQQLCNDLGIRMERAATAGTSPRFIAMIRELIVERIGQTSARPALGSLGAWHDVCPPDCCPRPERPGMAAGKKPSAP